MKKLFILLLSMCLIFCGCNNTNERESIKINLPNDDSVNGYRVITESSEDNIEYSYWGNKNSKKFHKSDCYTYNKTKSENIIHFNNKEEYLNNNYKPCQICKP